MKTRSKAASKVGSTSTLEVQSEDQRSAVNDKPKFLRSKARVEKPFISVIVTAYNRKEFLLQAVSSALRQTLPREYYEVIVVKNFEDEEIDRQLGDGASGLSCRRRPSRGSSWLPPLRSRREKFSPS